MTREEELQAIEDMGIIVDSDCPDHFRISVQCDLCEWYGLHRAKEEVKEHCGDCWIKSLEQPS